MKIILKENVEKLGFKDEMVTVKNGYARNFLIPKGKAVLATDSAVKILEEKLKQQSGKEEKVIADANNIAEVISNLEIVVKAKVAEGGNKLFGSITTIQFADSLAALGHEIDKRFVKLTTIKEIGKYEAEVRLHRNVSVTVPFEVVAE
jgi:large subunit ribosomal protein L9